EGLLDLALRIVNQSSRIDVNVQCWETTLLNKILQEILFTKEFHLGELKGRDLLFQLLNKMIEKDPEANFLKEHEFLKHGDPQNVLGIDVLFKDTWDSSQKLFILGKI